MVSINVTELKNKTNEIIKRVRENGEIFEISHQGKPIAKLIPINRPKPPDIEIQAILTDLYQLSAEISSKWPDKLSGVDVMKGTRRE